MLGTSLFILATMTTPGSIPATIPGFEAPFMIMDGSSPLNVSVGHAAPLVADWNKDGKKDLLVGQFGEGKLRCYINKGTDASPKFDGFTFVKAEGKDVQIVPSCCIGFHPQLIDLDGDKIDDLVSGEYSPGHIYFYKGTKDGFKAPVVIEETGADKSNTNMKYFMPVQNFVDWDGDGDYDMVVGSVKGDVYVNINTGTKTQYKFGDRQPVMLTDGKAMKVSQKSGPSAVDWDRDGILDLLVGDEWATITFFKGAKDHKFEPGKPLWMGGEPIGPAMAQTDPQTRCVPGFRVRLTTADWNNDGKLDLLVGNCDSGSDKGGYATDGHVFVFLRK